MAKVIRMIEHDDEELTALYAFMKRKHVKSAADAFLMKKWWAEAVKNILTNDDEAGNR